MIPDNGNLAEIAPIKLLLAMDEQTQTGILNLRKNQILKVFYLNQGKISWAISSDEEDKIEHILLAKNLLSPEALAPYLADNKIGESFGKILVENGLISLETLINTCRDQLKRIATSVLFWSSGTYQLEPESPPTRLVSLELEIAPLVYNYILTHMDVNIVWEELGSLTGKLQQATEPDKIFHYTLDSEQQEVFAYFREPQRPETVLLHFSAERKHTILKILYFFVITGLLIKKEAETIPAMDFNELDKLFGNDRDQSPQATASTELPVMINEAQIKDISAMDLPDIPDSLTDTKVTAPKFSDLNPNSKNINKTEGTEIPLFSELEKPPTRIQPLIQEKQKSKWLSISFFSILLAVIAIAVFLWLNRAPKNLEPEPVNKRPVAQTRRKIREQQGAIPVEQKVKPPDITLKQKAPVVTMEEKPQALKKDILPVKTLPNQTVNSRQAFAAEDFETAGNLWRQEMLTNKITHSILLEMDCLKESVQNAFQQITDKENFFIMNRVKDGRSCWLVLWGRFRTQSEATQNLRLIPEYFFKQSDPPRVIELEQYL